MRIFISLFLVSIISGPAFADEIDDMVATSKELINQFSTMLKQELVTAINEGGTANAISRCNIKAPEISSALAKDGWSIGRTSLKIRNPDNAPDEFENNILNGFEEKKAAGQDINSLAYYKLTEIGNRSEFRYMKAIPVGEMCLQCHGEFISEPVLAKLKELYPDDEAVNFQLGDIRGAFTLRKVFSREVTELENPELNEDIELPQFEE